MESRLNTKVKALRNVKNKTNNKTTKVIADRELKDMATLIFNQLQNKGCKTNDIISISSEILELVTNEISQPAPLVSNSK